MRIQYVKKFTGPGVELIGSEQNCYWEGHPDAMPPLEGVNWTAIRIQFLSEPTGAAIQAVMAKLPQ